MSYDKLSMWHDCKKTERILNLLTKVKPESVYEATGEVIRWKGRLSNLRVTVEPDRVGIIGSLPKYYFGNNFEMLSRQETKRALERLSDALHLPIWLANVYQLEFGANIILQNPVSLYLKLFHRARYFNEPIYYRKKQTVLYTSKRRALEFYNKIVDAKKKKMPIPEVFQSRNVLRYETKYNKRLAEQFGSSGAILAFQLYDENFYTNVKNKWAKEYFTIQKRNRFKLVGIGSMKNVREFDFYNALHGVESVGGEPVMIDLLENARKAGEINSKQYNKFKNRVRKYYTNEQLTEPDECILELDRKIRQAAACFR